MKNQASVTFLSHSDCLSFGSGRSVGLGRTEHNLVQDAYAGLLILMSLQTHEQGSHYRLRGAVAPWL